MVRRLSALRDSVAGLVSYSALSTIRYKLDQASHLRQHLTDQRQLEIKT